MFLNRLVKWLDNTDKNGNEWTIGVYLGDSPFNLAPSKRACNPVLTANDVTDINAAFVADPFMIRKNNLWYMFFEVYNKDKNRGEIGLATSTNGLKWQYRQIVLKEPFHLAYPYVFNWKDEYYILMSARKANSVKLYKAVNFPAKWVFVKDLIKGSYADASLIYYNKKWWMFAESRNKPEERNNTLRLFYSDNLEGNWKEHPKSPIVKKNAHKARPAGRMLIFDNKLIRFAQDCYSCYGNKVRAFKITTLNTKQYKEEEIANSPILNPSGKGWNAERMHHIDCHKIKDNLWLASVDGRKSA